MRSDNAALNGQKMDVDLILSPRQLKEKERDIAEKEAIRQHILRQLQGKSQKELTT